MLSIPPKLLSLYDQRLDFLAVPDYQRPHFRKWLRFYLDFCRKYNHSPRNKASTLVFIDKLREKGQAEWMQKQALDAVGIYLSLWDNDGPQGIKADSVPDDLPRISDTTPTIETSEGPVEVFPRRTIRSNNLVANSTVASNKTPSDSHPQNTTPFRRTAPAARTSKSIASPTEPQSFSVSPAPSAPLPSSPKSPANWPDLYDRITNAVKVRHYSPETLKSYTNWVRKFQGFTRNKRPSELTVDDVKAFLTHLAVERNVSASSQNLAFNALLFLFRHALGKEFGQVDGVVRAKKRPYIPVVLSREEVDRVIALLPPPCDLAAKLLYGCGLRLFECLKLRVQDINFDMGVLTVHDGKGQKDRTLPLPKVLLPELRAQLDVVIRVHRADLAAGYSGAFLPARLEQKFKSAAKELVWQWFFPATKLTSVPGTSERRRYHLHETALQKAIKKAVREAGIPKRASAYTLRHSYASHLLQANYDIRTIQELLGHSSVKTTMIYTHTVQSVTVKQAKSPLDLY